jgi:2'-5' RNA ligase
MIRDLMQASSKRLFFAIVPDPQTRAAIAKATQAAVAASGGRPVSSENLHVTIAFLGTVAANRVGLAASAAPVETGTFTLELGRYGHNGRVLWLEPLTVPERLVELEKLLWDRLVERGFIRENRAYRPHLTLARKARAVEDEPIGIRWAVDALALVESVGGNDGARYVPLQTWRL